MGALDLSQFDYLEADSFALMLLCAEEEIEMARINIEEEFYGSDLAGKMGIAMDIPKHYALGLCAYLWHDSQATLKIEGTAQDIIEWCRCDDKEVAAKLIYGLQRVHLIESIPGTDRYVIVGNETQIDNRVKMLKGGLKGADVTKAKWAAIKDERQKRRLSSIDNSTQGLGHGPRPSDEPQFKAQGMALGPNVTSIEDQKAQGIALGLQKQPQLEGPMPSKTSDNGGPGHSPIEKNEGPPQAQFNAVQSNSMQFNSPLPPMGDARGIRAQQKRLDEIAIRYADLVTSAMGRIGPEREGEARQELGERLWSIVIQKYNTWWDACNFWRLADNKQAFYAQLRDSLGVALREEVQAELPAECRIAPEAS